MAEATNKITPFPGHSDSHEPIASLPESLLGHDRDPTHEIRTFIENLQNAAREARRRQRHAEEEREQFRNRLAELPTTTQSDPANDSRVRTLTRERDMLLGQQSQYGPVISDLNKRLKEVEIELRETRSKRDEALRQKEAAILQRDLATEEQRSASEHVAAAKKNFAAAQKALAEARNELIALRKKGGTDPTAQIAALRQARDGMATQIKELQERISELRDRAAEYADARETADKAAKASAAQVEELKQALGTMAGRPANAERIEELEAKLNQLRDQNAGQQAELDTIRASLDVATRERDEIAAALEEARVSVLVTQEQIEAIALERDTLKEHLLENAPAIQAQLQEQAAEIDRLKKLTGDCEARLAENEQLESRFEQRRLAIIELNAQLENAHREIRNLSASLAEARLQGKVAARSAATASRAVPAITESAIPQAALAPPSRDPTCREEILAMRRCFQTFSRDQKQLGMLNELETYTLKIGGEAIEHGRPILHRMAVAFANLLADLLEVPDQITQSTLRTINQTIEFIALQLADPAIEGRINLKQARVYVVDDDQNTCMTVVDALNLVGLQTNLALYSSAAVAELAGNHYDLIILDVHMPDLSGFDLCSHIRTMALHAETPIFFITGDASLENRVKSSLRGGNEFIAKPFSIQEIALKALKSVISSQLKAH